MKEGADCRCSQAAREALGRRGRDFDAERWRRRSRRCPERLGVKPGKLYQPIRVAITGTHRLAGDLRVAGGARARASPWRGSTPRRPIGLSNPSVAGLFGLCAAMGLPIFGEGRLNRTSLAADGYRGWRLMPPPTQATARSSQQTSPPRTPAKSRPGPRQPPRGGLRGGRALPGPGRVPERVMKRRDRRDRAHRRPDRRGRVRRRAWRSRSCASPIAPAWLAGGVGRVPEAVDILKPSGVLAIAGTAPSSTSSSPTAAASCGPSASASTPWRPSAPPTRSAARSAGPSATSSPSRPCSTTSAGS